MDLSTVFKGDGPLCYCYDVKSFFEKFKKRLMASEWRFFLDSSKRSLKAVPLYHSNIEPSVSVAHSVHLKKSYKGIEILLNALQ